jgi:excisionase family DNA binding protein
MRGKKPRTGLGANRRKFPVDAVVIETRPPIARRTLQIREVIEVYGISRSHVYELAKEGQLPIRKLGRRSLIDVADIEALLRRNVQTDGGAK